jgi:hypothetical protein
MPDYHQGIKFSVRTTAKTIENFSYLPGINNRDRFEQVVALGLKMAQGEVVAPSTHTVIRPAPVEDKRAKLDSIMARFSEPVDLVARPKLAEFTDEEIIAYQRTWGRKRSLPAIHMLQQRVIDEGWQV